MCWKNANLLIEREKSFKKETFIFWRQLHALQVQYVKQLRYYALI